MKSKRAQRFGRPRILFPKDEGAHPRFVVEWWYGNFNLTDVEGREYGAMVAYFNPGLKIISISDLEAGSFRHEVSGSTPNYAEGRFDLRWGGGDRWFRTDVDSLSYHLKSYGTKIGFDLNLDSEKPPLLAGGNGIIRWSGGISYYYCLTRLRIEGQIKLIERMIDVKGIGWMDHQWMNSLGERGWDWFSVQLENRTDLNIWQIVNPDGSIESRALMILFPDNSIYHTRRLILETTDFWISPESGKEYGVMWRVQEKTNELDMVIKARYTGQEIRVLGGRQEGSFDFWEGSTAASGHLRGVPVSGGGHAEIVRTPRGTG